MIIPKRAVDKFLDRPRLDFRLWKNVSNQVIAEAKAQLPIQPPIWNKLKRHQRISFLIGAQRSKFAFFLDTGCGKTLLSLSLAWYFRRLGRVRRILVLVPNLVNKGEWENEIQKHVPGLPYTVLQESSEAKWSELENPKSLLYIETYAGLLHLACKRVPHKKKNKEKMVPDEKKIHRLQQIFDGLILDESVAVKNHGALPYRICKQLSKKSQILFLLTGTPFGRDPQDLWSQFNLVDGGHALGETLGLFRAAYFKVKKGFFADEYVLDSKKEQLLHRAIAHSSIRIPANEADLPRVVQIKKEVRLPEEANMYYERAKQTIIKANQNVREMHNAFLRMRQISSGWIGFKDDEVNDTVEFEFAEKPKLNMLMSIIQAIPEDTKAIIFHDFRYSGKLICRALDDAKIRYLYLRGGMKNVTEIRNKFEKDPRVQVLVLSSSAGGTGINLQVAKYGIYFESPVPVIMRTQTRARFIRQYSPHEHVFEYDIVTRGTADEKILEFHREGKSLYEALIEGKAKTIFGM